MTKGTLCASNMEMEHDDNMVYTLSLALGDDLNFQGQREV